jgi:hypothetical protein
MLRALLLVFAFILPNVSLSECWKVGEFSGVSAKVGDNYTISKDGMTGQNFMIKITGATTSVIPSDLSCKAASAASAVCIHSEKNRSVVETWSIDPVKKIAFYTKATSGYAIYDGPNLFVGKVLGPCN